MALFQAIVLNVWKSWRKDLSVQRATAERTLIDLRRRKEQLVEPSFTRAVDQTTHRQQRDKISESIAWAEIDRKP